MSKHTGGLWRVDKPSGAGPPQLEITSTEHIFWIAGVGAPCEDREVAEANARLMAAAPDLLAALRALKHSDGCYCDAAFAMSDTIVSHSEECKAALAAIAKATGGQDE